MITNKLNGKKYIGIALNACRRWTVHKRKSALNPKHALHLAMAKYGVENFSFEEIACTTTYQDLLALERTLIQQHNSFLYGGSGYNMTLGGEGALGYKPTDKQLELLRNRVITQETKRLISASLKARNWTPPPEHMAKLIASATGRVMSDENRKAISLRRKGTVATTETREKMRVAKLGGVHSDQHKEKLAAVRATQEWKDKSSASHKGQVVPSDHPFRNGIWSGRKHSDETRAKMSASAKIIANQPEFQQRFEKTRGVLRSEEVKQRMRDGWALKVNRSLSENHKEKISLALKGRLVSPETREKSSVAQKGRLFTEEHKAALRAAWIIRKERTSV